MANSNRAASQWDRANASYEDYLAYISRRRDRYRLTLIDLLYVRNFKGQSSSVHEPEAELNPKLRRWSGHLRAIAQLCDGDDLRSMPMRTSARLRTIATAFLEMTDVGPRTKTGISGFRASHASVLLHTRFPDVFPILDRRVLKGSRIIRKRRRAEPSDYPALIDHFRKELRARPDVAIRDLDRKFFVKR